VRTPENAAPIRPVGRSGSSRGFGRGSATRS
jgi:hypothetical protein